MLYDEACKNGHSGAVHPAAPVLWPAARFNGGQDSYCGAPSIWHQMVVMGERALYSTSAALTTSRKPQLPGPVAASYSIA